MISSGHSLENIKHYTLPQIQLFAKEIGQIEAQSIRRMAMATRSAGAEQKEFQKIMRNLDGEAD